MAMSLALRPALFADQLEKAVEAANTERPFLVDGLLYQRGSILVSGDPGTGKSLAMLVAFAQATAGLPVFGQLPCARPLNCYCLFSERINQEAVERLRLIRKVVPVDWRRLYLDDGYVGIADVTKANWAQEMLERVGKATYPDGGKADLVALDSLYGFIPGGLSKDEKASEFARFHARLQSELGVSSWLVHHTTKPQYSRDNGQQTEKDDPYYGSQWLKAMVTGSYHLAKHGDGVRLLNKKDTFGALLKELPLSYDPETHMLALPTNFGVLSAVDRTVFWLIQLHKSDPGRRFSFDELCQGVGISHQHGRRLMQEPAIQARLSRAGTTGPTNSKLLYQAVSRSESPRT